MFEQTKKKTIDEIAGSNPTTGPSRRRGVANRHPDARVVGWALPSHQPTRRCSRWLRRWIAGAGRSQRMPRTRRRYWRQCGSGDFRSERDAGGFVTSARQMLSRWEERRLKSETKPSRCFIHPDLAGLA